MRFYSVLAMLVLTVALGGCFGGSSDGNEDPMSAGLNYYYAEFSDVAIPNEMKPDKNDTFITYTSDGIKLGTQLFKGRVEVSSLVTALQGYMQRDGWTLRSVFRATRGAILIFEQQQKMCSMYVFEDVINTGLLVFVSPKLADGALQYNAPSSMATEPMGAADPVIGSGTGTTTTSGNITVYPAK
ncbi:MAG: hypothetical protein LIP28_09925 [Deltaproteobacteria bacterium]|nr:hypothetical protein [Deltaproteobacteria bacterium]